MARRTPRPAPTRSESLEDLSSEFLACRDNRHHWGRVNMKVTETTRRGYAQEVTRWKECDVCGTELEQIFELPSCDKKSQKYIYPAGYLLAKGVTENGRVDVRDVRRLVFAREGIQF